MAGLKTVRDLFWTPFQPPPGSLLLAHGEQRFVNRPQAVYLTPGSAAAHGLVLGQTGSGKTKLLEHLCRQMLVAGRPFCLLDLHGDLAPALRDYAATLRTPPPLLWLDASDPRRSATYNPIAATTRAQAATQLLEVVAAFRRQWSDSCGPRLADLLTHTLGVLQAQGLTLVEAPLLLGDPVARARLLADRRVSVMDLQYFKLRYDPLPVRDRVLMSESTSNKLGALLSDYRVRTMLGMPQGTLVPRDVLASGTTVLARIPRGALVENADVLASLLLSGFHTAAMAREALPPAKRRPYALVIDEAQVASDTFPQLLAGGRAFGISAICGLQYLDQVPPQLSEALLGNCRVRVAFRLSRRDAERVARELFRADGDHIKHQDYDLLGSRRSRPVFWTVPEEWEYAIRELQDQHAGECVIQIGREPPWFAETVQIAPARPSTAALASLEAGIAEGLLDRAGVLRLIAARARRLTTTTPTTKGGAHDQHDDAVEPLAPAAPNAQASRTDAADGA